MKNWNNYTNILCVRTDNMGDVLMTTPAFRGLKESLPKSHLTLLTSKAGNLITPFIEEIDDVIVFDVPWTQSQAKHTNSDKLQALIAQLKDRRFDAAIIFTVFSQSPLPAALTCFLADIPNRLAYCHENPYQLLTNWLPDPEPKQCIRHEVVRQLALIEAVGATTNNSRLSLQVPQEAKEKAKIILRTAGINLHKPWLIIHPGASSGKRHYTTAGFVAAGKTLINTYGYQLVFTGTEREERLIQPILAHLPNHAVSLAGKLTLSELIGLVTISPLLISVNTGTVHIAAAVGTPVVDLYALTNPQHTPWKVPNKVLYFPVHKKLRQNIVCELPPENGVPLTSPEQIIQAVNKLLPYATARIQLI